MNRDSTQAHAPAPHPLIEFEPVTPRARHDGWSPQTQRRFLLALAESACVVEAARAAGMSPSSAYALRRRADAAAFRGAWQVALDYATHRLSEAALGRALKGVTTPVFYRGEQVGERVRYDERLTQFLLSRLDVRFATLPPGTILSPRPDAGAVLAKALDGVDPQPNVLPADEAA